MNYARHRGVDRYMLHRYIYTLIYVLYIDIHICYGAFNFDTFAAVSSVTTDATILRFAKEFYT